MKVYLALLLTEFLDPVMNLTEDDEGMKKWQTNGYRVGKKKMVSGGMWWRNHRAYITEQVYYVKLNKRIGLLHKMNLESKITVFFELGRRQGGKVS